MRRFFPKIVTVGLLACLPLAAHALEFYTIDPAKSSLNFRYQQMGVKLQGKFKQFNAQLRFDPNKPQAASLSFDVPLASVAAGSDADRELAGKSWFNTANFPTAHFVAQNIKASGDNRFEINGQLTLKGKTHPVSIPVALQTQGKSGVFKGQFNLRRSDFSIGEGAWSSFDVVANDIGVEFQITALTH